ncbi:threonine-phosphate decarboxylase [Aliiroseovarius subalbicans]|uniref:threonine-phosphate decarboxylase n=1 Tax=Aliiroseovarius subalbicans TaxID=2925840 RepID=UPI001F5AE9FB|nr:threonine-phosphate decarboxylase [Aliiroseovarius subalbicans]MCI2399763.1 pyridoxal phosphate-dependent class II aminotransferase [Aliiroseovarius subalbicans]
MPQMSAHVSVSRDHGGGLDAAIAQYGGVRSDWLDLSTGINPHAYPVGDVPAGAWQQLPDRSAFDRLEKAARAFWSVPDDAAVLAAPGASSIIARIPTLAAPGVVDIPAPTYNEHAAAFQQTGWQVGTGGTARVLVHPNNPDGRLWHDPGFNRPLTVIDESFCDVVLGVSHIAQAPRPGVVILKSFGKFWGLAGLRLGFAIGEPKLIARLRDSLGPWQVSGPALTIGATALEDMRWANRMRQQLAVDAARLDAMVMHKGADLKGGTALFRLYEVDDAAKWQKRLAKRKVWSRTFPYSKTWLRLGLPPSDRWAQLERAV